MKPYLYPLFLILLLLAQTIFAQNRTKIDSLRRELKKADSDTLKAKLLAELSLIYSDFAPDTAILYGKQGLALVQKSGEKKYIANSLRSMGLGYEAKGDYAKALDCFQKSLKIYEKLDDQTGIANVLTCIGRIYEHKSEYPKALAYYQQAYKILEKCTDPKYLIGVLNNIGNVYTHQGEYPKALDYFQKARIIAERRNDKHALATILSNIGNIYEIQEEHLKALDYLQRSRKIYEAIGEQDGTATVFTNIGLIYYELHNYSLGLDYLQKSRKIFEAIGNPFRLSYCLANIGIIYEKQGDYSQALNYFHQSRKIKETIDDLDGLANVLHNIGVVYLHQSNTKEALRYHEQALALSFQIGSKENINKAYYLRSQIESDRGDYNSALAYYKLWVVYRDSLFNEEKTKEIGKLEGKYEIEKAQEAEKQKQTLKAEAAERRNNLQYLLIFAGVTIFFLSLFFIGKLRLPLVLSEGLIFLAFLTLFEFILIVFDPVLDKYTGGIPIQKLGLNIVLAAIFTPLHRFLENRLKKRVVSHEIPKQ